MVITNIKIDDHRSQGKYLQLHTLFCLLPLVFHTLIGMQEIGDLILCDIFMVVSISVLLLVLCINFYF